MGIDIVDRQTDLDVDQGVLCRVVKKVLEDAGCTKSVSVALVDADEMKKLNRSYKGRDDLTDVLAFPMGKGKLLGDVVVCPAKAKMEADARSCEPMSELLLYAVHGTLHLLGYDDQGEEAEEMYAKEDEILGAFGVEVD
ncbi:rRNA maturation RNase YbeY [Planctomycetota bacterium]